MHGQGSAPPLSPSSTSPVPPFSAGPYGPPAASISPQPPTAPVHYHAGSQDISEENIWKDFPPLKLPPVHLPTASNPIKQSNVQHKQESESQIGLNLNGHSYGGHSKAGVITPVKSVQVLGHGSHHQQQQFPGQFTVMDEAEDHPGMRKNSGFLQPMKHLSGKAKNKNIFYQLIPHRNFDKKSNILERKKFIEWLFRVSTFLLYFTFSRNFSWQ